MRKNLLALFSLLLFLGSFENFAQTPNTPKVENPKLRFGLSELVNTAKNSPNFGVNDIPDYKQLNLKAENAKILVDVITPSNGYALMKELSEAGAEIVAHNQTTVTCWVEISKIENTLATIKGISWMQSVLKPNNNAGVVQSQGDAAQRSNIARSLYGVSGAGVKIGVLSDSYNRLGGAAAGILAGELLGVGNPNGRITPVTVLSDLTSSGSDEGRAMLEIVHDVAPGAQLYFYSAFNGEVDFANGIRALADAGCKVIIDDITYFAEPVFQDGVIAQAIEYAVTVKGASYFSSAGNEIDKSYEAPYRASTFQSFNNAMLGIL
jgi:hypothetical protein